MKTYYLLLILVICFAAGCQTPQDAEAGPSLDGVTFDDLDNPYKNTPGEPMVSFSVMTYTIVPDSVGRLNDIFDSLSRKDVRVMNRGAFYANGFAIGTASAQQRSEVIRKINKLGAKMPERSGLTLPAEKSQPLSPRLLNGTETFSYAETGDRIATMTPPEGFIGWVFAAKPDPKYRGTAQVRLFPATWRPSLTNIRLTMGQEAVDYESIAAGRVLVRMEEGGLLLLGPSRHVPEQITLDKLLFHTDGRRPELKFFVIYCSNTGHQ